MSDASPFAGLLEPPPLRNADNVSAGLIPSPTAERGVVMVWGAGVARGL